MRRKDDTLRETLLDYARDIAHTNGPDAINIRALAKRAGIATGTVYNYFKDKDDLLLALTEEYWRTTLAELPSAVTAVSFLGQLEEIYGYLKRRIDDSGGMLMGSLHGVETAGRERMASMQAVLGSALIRRIEQDAAINGSVWIETFAKEDCARFIMGNFMLALRSGQEDIRFLIEIIHRTIY